MRTCRCKLHDFPNRLHGFFMLAYTITTTSFRYIVKVLILNNPKCKWKAISLTSDDYLESKFQICIALKSHFKVLPHQSVQNLISKHGSKIGWSTRITRPVYSGLYMISISFEPSQLKIAYK